LHLSGAIFKEAIAVRRLEVQRQSALSRALEKARLQVNAALCGQPMSMFFWRIDALKAQLRDGPLPQAAAFAYVFVGFFVMNAFFGIPGLWNAETSPTTPWAWATYVVTLALFAAGTYTAYRVNGGPQGVDFAARYLALGWVLSIRLFVLVFVPLLLLALVVFVVMALAQGDAASTTGASEDLAPDWLIELVIMAWLAFFYWRLVRHFQDVATRPAAPAGMHSPAA
jgi:hypothetical protein